MSARGGNVSHWEGCEEAHHDCALRFLEEARTALSAKQAELDERTRERDEALGERDMANEYIGRAREHINAQLGIRTPFFDDVIVLAVNYALEAEDRARETQKTCDEVQAECRQSDADATERLRWGIEEIEKVRAERDALRGQLAACVSALRKAYRLLNGDIGAAMQRESIIRDSSATLASLSDAAAAHDRAMRIEGAREACLLHYEIWSDPNTERWRPCTNDEAAAEAARIVDADELKEGR